MKQLNKILGIGALALMASCGSTERLDDRVVHQGSKTLQGRAVSVANAYGQSMGYISAVIDAHGEEILASCGGNTDADVVANATALIQSTINKSDEEIKMTGEYKNGIFQCDSLAAKGYKIKF